jgi:hypothetical protein
MRKSFLRYGYADDDLMSLKFSTKMRESGQTSCIAEVAVAVAVAGK